MIIIIVGVINMVAIINFLFTKGYMQFNFSQCFINIIMVGVDLFITDIIDFNIIKDNNITTIKLVIN